MNKKFDSLTKKEKRVILAKDVIKQINAKRLSVLRENAYIEVACGYKENELECLLNEDVLGHRAVRLLQKTCNVCAKGALLLSRIDKFNTLCPVDIGLRNGDRGTQLDCDNQHTEDGLDDIFSKKQLNKIEDAFETSPDRLKARLEYERGNISSRRITDAEKFGGCFEDDYDRLIAIMQNIIDHNGTFKPKVKYEMVN